jgi:hypothetical protein
MSQQETIPAPSGAAVRAAESYLGLVVAGDADGIARLFAGEAVINDPAVGPVEGREGIARVVAGAVDGVAARRADVQHLRTTHAERRTVAEQILHLEHDGRRLELPVGVLAVHDDGGRATELHVYHTMWPVRGGHSIRPAFVRGEDVGHSDVVAEFVMSLRTGDVEASLRLFEADMYMREASGPPYVHWGRADVAGYFNGLFSPGGPMIRKNTVTDDGRCACMEFDVVGWAGEAWPEARHQAGLAVYERASTSKLRAIRIYDDVAF